MTLWGVSAVVLGFVVSGSAAAPAPLPRAVQVAASASASACDNSNSIRFSPYTCTNATVHTPDIWPGDLLSIRNMSACFVVSPDASANVNVTARVWIHMQYTNSYDGNELTAYSAPFAFDAAQWSVTGIAGPNGEGVPSLSALLPQLGYVEVLVSMLVSDGACPQQAPLDVSWHYTFRHRTPTDFELHPWNYIGPVIFGCFCCALWTGGAVWLCCCRGRRRTGTESSSWTNADAENSPLFEKSTSVRSYSAVSVASPQPQQQPRQDQDSRVMNIGLGWSLARAPSPPPSPPSPARGVIVMFIEDE
jgi:hypothetical protein